MSEPVAILPAIQRGDMDCGLCCLQMLADRSYDALRDEALRLYPKLHERGLFISEIRRVARRVGLRLVKRTPAEADEGTGLLDVDLQNGSRHFVVVFQGVVLNPADGLTWDQDTYRVARVRKARGFYTVEAA